MSDWNAETAEWYAHKYGEYPTNKLGIEALKLPDNSIVIDIGCGTGCALRHAAKQVTQGVLIGIDPVPRMIEIAREKTTSDSTANNIIFKVGSAEDIPIENNSADFILAFDSFDHWENQQQGLKEIHRVLKPEGCFIVVKDGGLPNGTEARQSFLETLASSAFKIVEEQTLEDDEVSFTLWIYEKE
ncbi:class I SAM-dependent methyltransferase [Zooshikella harenae]|uniref:Class I SAM-dependent methyltransferase n=1 Tax=Zooshikella harenae TaxID=2827238 RepID=A0ABS5ZA76_9GAMM|nr:class I SAM-dependent methyltransferase [Zooshikella harenae]MBU2710788.1 class I SAM-dependent methyltransferase [Zooshikella harenae]